MIIPIELQVIKVDVPFLVIGLYLALVAISYALIFYKHHKRNHVEVFELIELFTKYFAVVTLTLIISIIGVDFILVAHEYIDTRVDVIVNVSIGIAIISAAIIHLIFYVKKRLKDFDPNLREADQKHNKKIGEILELIVFIILLTTPLWRIPSFIELYNPDNNKEFIKAIIEAFAICISAGFLLLAYNPLDIKGKLFKDEKSSEDKEIIEEKEEPEDREKEKEPVKEENKTKKKKTDETKPKKKSTGKNTKGKKSNSSSKKGSSKGKKRIKKQKNN